MGLNHYSSVDELNEVLFSFMVNEYPMMCDVRDGDVVTREDVEEIIERMRGDLTEELFTNKINDSFFEARVEGLNEVAYALFSERFGSVVWYARYA